ERQLSLLHRRGFRGVTVAEALTDPPAGRVLAVTFDDAYRSVLELARPILESLGMVASVYVVTGWAERPGPMSWPGIDQWVGGPHEQELACMGWDELRSLADGGWEVGSHTRSHPRLPLSGQGLARCEAGAGVTGVGRARRRAPAAAGRSEPLAGGPRHDRVRAAEARGHDSHDRAHGAVERGDPRIQADPERVPQVA